MSLIVSSPICTVTTCDRRYCQEKQSCERAVVKDKQDAAAALAFEHLEKAYQAYLNDLPRTLHSTPLFNFWSRVAGDVQIEGIEAILNQHFGRLELPPELPAGETEMKQQ